VKLFIITFLILALNIQSAKADCDYSKIVSNPDGTYTYSRELNKCVGGMKRDLDAANAQIEAYTKALTLKDLAIQDSDKRANMWETTALSLESRVTEIDKLESKQNVGYFLLGILVSGVAVYGAGQLRK
jgi:hypothetical protein